MIKLLTMAITLVIAVTPLAFSQIVINEIMYAPASPNKEWFELHNISDTYVNIQNWKWKDAAASNPMRVITSAFLEIPPKSFLLVCEDSANVKAVFPGTNGIYTQSAGWNALNNSGNENLVIYNSLGIAVDSLTYNSNWGGGSGKSLEKKIAENPANNQSNWSTSVDPLNATPLRRNSVTPRSFDLALKSIKADPVFPVKGDDIRFSFTILNNGINAADNFSFKFYNDINFDSNYVSAERIDSFNYPALNPGDSIVHYYEFDNADSGKIQIIAVIDFIQDEDTLNNKLIKSIYVSPQNSENGGIVINEIMFDPLQEQSEWIEVYNATGLSFNLKNWKYRETSSFINISAEDLIFKPGDYLILAHDSSIYDLFTNLKNPASNQIIKFSNSLSLSNNGEMISLTDSVGTILDAVSYSPEWSNPNLPETKGISLERINPGYNSNDRSNWSSCAKQIGGTPGEKNSIHTNSAAESSEITITPNPFSPDGDGHEDYTLISYRLNLRMAQLRVKVYDIKGRLVRTLSNNSVTGTEGEIIFNGYDDSNKKLRTGIYILYIEAIDISGVIIGRIKAPMVIAAKL